MFAIIQLTGVPFFDLIIIGAGIGCILWAMKKGKPKPSDPF